MLWNNVELAMEMVIKRRLQLTTEQASMVCGPLGGGAKFSLLKSLLEGSNPELVDAVKFFQEVIGRNALVHGFITFENPEDMWSVVSREVRDKLTVRAKSLERYMADDVVPAFDRVVLAADLTDEEMHEYGREIAALAHQV